MQPVVNMPGMGCMEKEKWLINEGENTGKLVGGLDSFFFPGIKAFQTNCTKPLTMQSEVTNKGITMPHNYLMSILGRIIIK